MGKWAARLAVTSVLVIVWSAMAQTQGGSAAPEAEKEGYRGPGDFDADLRIVNRRHLPSSRGEKIGVASRAASQIERLPRRDLGGERNQKSVRFSG